MTSGIAIVGATGSIGRQALDVIARYPDDFEAVVLASGGHAGRMLEAAARAPLASLWVAERTAGADPAWESGDEALRALILQPRVDTVLVAVNGARALRAALWAVEAGKRLALATKEVLVLGGELVMAAARRTGAQVLPVDSEHSALWQCLWGEDSASVSRLWLTASGGPFLDRDPSELARTTPQEAVRHPRWRMGEKVSVDSATLMNKGLEVIEAHWLFGVAYDRIAVAVHRQSLVHGLVEFVDGSFKAELCATDMRLPIALALSYPRRLPGVLPVSDASDLGTLTFERLDTERFPAVELARSAGITGGTAPATLNAANEEAVAAFLGGELPFNRIVPMVAEALAATPARPASDLEALLSADAAARAWVRGQLRAAGVGAS